MGVEAGGDGHQAGPVIARDRHDDVLDQRREHLVPAPGGHRHVEGEPRAIGLALVAGLARPRIERPLMDARVEHLGRGGEDRLRAVAVVDVPVEHEDAPRAARLDRVRRRDRDVVEKAETHRSVAARRGGRGAQSADGELILAP